MKFKRIISILAGTALAAALLTGCGTQSASTSSQTAAAGGAAGEKDQTDGTAVETVSVAMVTVSDISDMDEIVARCNDILAPKGIALELIPLEFADYVSTINMTLSGGDNSIDLFNRVWCPGLTTLAAQGQVLNISDLLDQYGQGILELIDPAVMQCTYVNDGYYGVPTYGTVGLGTEYLVRTDIAENLESFQSSVDGYDSLTPIFAEIKEKYPEYSIVPTGQDGRFTSMMDVDKLGNQECLGVLMHYGENLNVENYFESEDFYDFATLMHEWQEAGYFISDPLNQADGANAAIMNGVSAGSFHDGASAEMSAAAMSSTTNVALTGIQVTKALASTATCTNSAWCVNAATSHPEAAVKMLNELYTNEEVIKLLCNGLEGIDYVVEDGVSVYPEGKDTTNVGWPAANGWFFPNATLSWPAAPNPADLYDQYAVANDNAINSQALGFVFDTSNVTDEITACTNVVAQYLPALMCGLVDVDSSISDFNAALYAGGLQAIMDEEQSQLDAWAAARE